MMSERRTPHVHSVHFYDYDGELITRLRGVMVAAMANGNSALIVASQAHRDQLLNALNEHWPPWTLAATEGRFLMFDARETMEQFMVNGRPDRAKFMASVGKLVNSSRERARSANRGLTVFGEMVAELWADGNKQGALELEALWNDLLSHESFHLHCAYPKNSLGIDEADLQEICNRHSHVVKVPAMA